MESEPRPRRGRPPKPAALRRTETLKLSLTPPEMEAAEARARMAGMRLAEWARIQVCGSEPEQMARRSRGARRQRAAERSAPGDFDALVARYSRTMPRRNAETLARRELGRG